MTPHVPVRSLIDLLLLLAMLLVQAPAPVAAQSGAEAVSAPTLGERLAAEVARNGVDVELDADVFTLRPPAAGLSRYHP